MKKIVIWPAGRRTKKYLRRGYFETCEIIGVVDREKGRAHSSIEGYEIQPLEMLKEMMGDADYLVIAAKDFEPFYSESLRMGIPWEKIALAECIRSPIFSENINRIRSISEKLYQEILYTPYQLTKVNQKDIVDTKRLIPDSPFDDVEYRSDYFRYRTFEFVAEELLEHDIVGDLAEFGVFQAGFSKLIMEKLPDRKMYWFDTFQSFSPEENKKETALGRSSEEFYEALKDTSVDRALGNVSHPENVIVCKGLFPASVTEEAKEARFAFVSIDVDLEDSTYEGLKFFYPRLNDGGMIFLHDYNEAHLVGVQAAVKRYEADFSVKFKAVPLADRAGTLAIIK